MVLMPSCTVPRFSNNPATSHRIQSDIMRRRITRPMATAMAPSEISDWCQANTAIPAMDTSSSEFRVCRVTVS